MTKLRNIRSLADLCKYFSADDARSLNRRVYKDTTCGASISVYTAGPGGRAYHNGQDWSGLTSIDGFTIQTIVEGSDATVDSGYFKLPVKTAEVDAWIEEMEAEADRLRDEAHESDESG